LSGCNTSSNNEIEIVSHHIETKTEYINEGGHIGVGEAKDVTGTIRNIADRNIDRVTITVHFYDSSNELLQTKTTTVSYLAKGQTVDFKVDFNVFEPYYAQYDHYTVSVST
jgi:ribose 5-phosphate isomerase